MDSSALVGTLVLLIGEAFLRVGLVTAQLPYPVTRTVDQIDDYHGIQVADPYRWLEDDTSAATAAWVKAQNQVTSGYLDTLPGRAELRRRLEEVYDYPKYTLPLRKGRLVVFRKNAGLQDQSMLYAQRGDDGEPWVLLDPNKLSADGTTRLMSMSLSKDARYLAYTLSQAGTDWQEYFVKDIQTGNNLPDHLSWLKFGSQAWRGHGFYYTRFPPSDTTRVLSARNETSEVWYHRLGQPQAADTLVFADTGHPERLYGVTTTEDERFVVLTITNREGGGHGNALSILDVAGGTGAFVPVITQFEDYFRVIDNEMDKLLVLTNHRAPNWRLVLIDPANPDEANWGEIIPEQEQPLENVTAAGGKLFATYRRDVAHRVYVLDRAGRFENEIRLPAIGLASGFEGQRRDQDVFWSFTSFTFATTLYRYDIAARTSSVFQTSAVKFNIHDYETRQVFVPSRDGTKIPMFIVYRKGLKLDGRNPALIFGYGGFSVPLGPSFNPLLIPLLERGVVYALVNARGGGEYGETWHRAGWRANKQQVFDDFIAGAEWLQASGYTSKDRCALRGGSNGGLLVGAVMTQRPDLCRVALPAAGVLDMLRFQRFTIGWLWTAEYGSSDDPKMFPILLGYSPLHNIRKGVNYPATLITAADHDDRVVPAHSFKFAATLQNYGRGPNPYLIRIETRSGHGGVNTTKELDETADVYAFMLAQMPENLTP